MAGEETSFSSEVQGLIEFAKAEEHRGLVGVDKKGHPFNASLRRTRQDLGLTQEAFAAMLGVNNVTISKIERFHLFPNEGIRRQIATFAGVSPSELFPDWLQEFTTVPLSDDGPQVELVYEDRVSRLGLIEQQIAISDFQDPSVDPHEQVEKRDVRDIFWGFLQQDFLTTPEKETIIYRTGFTGEEPKTLTEVRVRLGVSVERVRQIEIRAFRKLSRPSQKEYLKEYGEEYGKPG